MTTLPDILRLIVQAAHAAGKAAMSAYSEHPGEDVVAAQGVSLTGSVAGIGVCVTIGPRATADLLNFVRQLDVPLSPVTMVMGPRGDA